MEKVCSSPKAGLQKLCSHWRWCCGTTGVTTRHTADSWTTLLTDHMWKHDASTPQHGNSIIFHLVSAYLRPLCQARKVGHLGALAEVQTCDSLGVWPYVKTLPAKARSSCKVLRQSRHTLFCRHSAAHLKIVCQIGSTCLDATISRGNHHFLHARSLHHPLDCGFNMSASSTETIHRCLFFAAKICAATPTLVV